MGSSLGWESEPDVRDSAMLFASSTLKRENLKLTEIKVARAYFDSKKTVHV